MEAGTSTVREIIGLLPDSDIPYTTVASIVNNLKRKNYLIASQNGNTYEYTPLIAENEYKSTFMEGFVRDYFGSSYKEMVSFFAQEQNISSEELKEVIRIIEKGPEEEKK
ncbi:MAG: BlaI/MecI/CopY family transcriptional regulator [Bacteroidaceae bacterium]